MVLLIVVFFIDGYGQGKNFIDQAYLETSAAVDTLVTPDKIYISIVLSETDNKNKKSTEELEQQLHKKLKELGVNVERDLTLLDYNSDFKSYFLKGQNIVKVKNYLLNVRDAVMAAKVFTGLEEVGISNVSIERTEYSKAEQLALELKSKAILKAKQNADRLVEPLNQKTGKAIFISDINSTSNLLQGKVAGVQIRGSSSLYGSRAPEPMLIDFQKIKFESQVTVRFAIE